MTQLEQWQVERIENTLRLVANNYNSKDRETCLDRDIMLCWNMVCDALQDKPIGETVKYRYHKGQIPEMYNNKI